MRALVSFCLKAYNQKSFIGEALEGAFAQTYRPLEIVVCDDHSTDGTWELLVEKAEAWRRANRDPDVTLVLHRNERNLGNCTNWEMCGKLAYGELLIKAGGDDVSLPERTARIVEAWDKAGRGGEGRQPRLRSHRRAGTGLGRSERHRRAASPRGVHGLEPGLLRRVAGGADAFCL